MLYLWPDENGGFSTSIRIHGSFTYYYPNYSIVFPSFFLRFVLTGDSNTLRIVEYFFATKKEGKKIAVFRNIRIHVDSLNVTLLYNVQKECF